MIVGEAGLLRLWVQAHPGVCGIVCAGQGGEVFPKHSQRSPFIE